MLNILLVDDEQQWLDSFKSVLANHKITREENIFTAQNCAAAMDILLKHEINIVFLDLILENENGEDILKKIKENYPEMIVAIMSGVNDVFAAVSCMREGAADYLVKTASVEEHMASVRRVASLSDLMAENKALREGMLADYDSRFDQFITSSPTMHSIFKYLTAVVASQEPVLICGESGVGKGVLAKAFAGIARPDKPFVSVNIAGLDDQVFSDTLYGHIKGAYTGADHARAGLIQQANDGVIFMDEIGELPVTLQIKLLYLLQDRVYQQLGSDNVLRTNARFVLATNENLKDKQEAGQFRKDLFYRISTHSVTIPALRDRKSDIPLLFEHFLKEISEETGVNMPSYKDSLIYYLMDCTFPGNVRQLRAAVYNAVLKTSGTLEIRDFFELEKDAASIAKFTERDELPTVDRVVDHLINEAMKRSGNNQKKAAELIGLSQSTLSRRLKEL